MTLPHRPTGSGSTTVRIAKRTDNNGYFLFIGRKLYQDKYIKIDKVSKNAYEIRHSDTAPYTVTNTGQNGMPRISIGEASLKSLSLTGGEWEATVKDNKVLFVK